MKQEITMGSLFSGSGGFELAGSIFGIRPIWASESVRVWTVHEAICSVSRYGS